MASKIQLTPAELLSQSQEMLSLQKEFNDLFTQSGKLLNQVNTNWSTNLANNFAGKLTSAQKGFKQIVSMLEQGGRLAEKSANTFENMDSLLAKNMSGDVASALAGVGAVAMGVGGKIGSVVSCMGMDSVSFSEEKIQDVMESVSGSPQKMKEIMSDIMSDGKELAKDAFAGLKQDWQNAKGFLEDIQGKYEELPPYLQKDVKTLAKNIFGKEAVGAYEITYDIVTGDVSWDTMGTFVGLVKDSTTGKVVKKVFNYATSEETQALDQMYMNKTKEEFSEGHVVAGITNMLGSFTDEILVEAVDIAGTIAVEGFLGKIPGLGLVEEQLGFTLSEVWEDSMADFHAAATEGIASAVEAIGNAEDFIQDTVAEAASNAYEFAKDAAENAYEYAQEAAENVAEYAQEAAETAKAVSKEIAKGAKKIATSVGEGLEDIGDGIADIFCW